MVTERNDSEQKFSSASFRNMACRKPGQNEFIVTRYTCCVSRLIKAF